MTCFNTFEFVVFYSHTIKQGSISHIFLPSEFTIKKNKRKPKLKRITLIKFTVRKHPYTDGIFSIWYNPDSGVFVENTKQRLLWKMMWFSFKSISHTRFLQKKLLLEWLKIPINTAEKKKKYKYNKNEIK